MVSLRIMTPTRTIRKHLFVLDDTHDFDTASRVLVSLGFKMFNNSDIVYSKDDIQIQLKPSPNDSNEQYIGGCIYPLGGITKRIPDLISLMRAFGHLFIGLILLYAALWVVAFILALADYSPEVLGLFFGLPIGVSFLLGMACATITAVLGIGTEYNSTNYNRKMMETVYPLLISSFEHLYPDLVIHPISIRTRLGSSDVVRHLPEDFVSKLRALDLISVNEFFWSN